MAFVIPQAVSEFRDTVLADAYNDGQVDFDVLCNRLSARVYDAEFADPEVSGMVRREQDESFSIYLNHKHHENRKRFTLAHEIGHIISFLAVSHSHDKLLREGFIERKAIQKVTDPAESEANEIAATILMPKEFIVPYISKLQNPTVERLAEVFGVSSAAMSIRLSNFGYMYT